MSVIATAVRHLMAAGVTGDALIAAIEDMEAQVRAEPKPRSAGAIRQERYRENQRNKASQVTVSDGCDAFVTPLSLPPNENISNPPTHTPGNNTRARKGAGNPATPAKPEAVSDDVWRDFLLHRKRKHADVTPTAMAVIEREARNAGWPLESALAEVVTSGWASFKAEYVKDRPKPSATAANDDPLTRRLMARKAAQQEAQRA